MEKIELSLEQKQSIIDFWNKTPNNPPSVKDIVIHVFGEEHDHRAPESKAIVGFLASRRLKPKPRTLDIEISEGHKEFIKSNAATMNALEMAKIIFNNQNLTNLNAETRAINEFLKSLIESDVTVGSDVDEVPDGEYQVPNTIHKVIKKVNTYTSSSLNADTLTPTARKGLEALIKYLSAYRFYQQINSYDLQSDRKSFEDAFIRYTFNKPELTQEEIDQYITLANQVVLAFKAQRRSERLQKMLDTITKNDEESIKISMSLVEMIGKAQTEYNLCVKRQSDLLEDLTEKRSEKLSKQIKDTASVLNLFQAWKHEENRKKWAKLVEIEDRAIENEIDKMTSMDEIKGKILGLTKEEAKYG